MSTSSSISSSISSSALSSISESSQLASTSSKGILERLDHARLPQSLRAELVEVYARLHSCVQGLQYPLNELLNQEIEQAYPFANAGIVLTAGVNDADDEVLRQRRIHLASALEMLRIALTIHNTLLAQPTGALLAADTDVEHLVQNKSLIGSVILAGDHCFSCSAHMAAQTDNPDVVALFAQALKELSEEHLRHAFISKTENVTKHQILFRSGVESAARLASLPPQALAQNLYISGQLAQAIDAGSSPETLDTQQIDVPTFQYERWQCVIQWVLDSHNLQ